MQKLASLSILFLLFICFYKTGALPTDTIPTATALKIDSLKIDSLKTSVRILDSSTHKTQSKTDSSLSALQKQDSAYIRAVDSSFSKDLAMAKLHPEKLYHPLRAHIIISIIAFIFLALFLYKSFSYAANSALCRDESYYKDEDGNIQLKPYGERPFSYSRSQLFWWTVIIVSCYTVFYALNGTLLPLNSTILMLIGTGLATFIFGKTIDQNQIQNNNLQTSDVQNNNVQNKNIQNNSLQSQKKNIPTRHQDIYASSGFLTDILSDENGISIHRLQAVAFNIIYGIGFVGYFISNTNLCQYPFEEFEQ